MKKIDEIYAAVVQEMAEKGVPDTNENRYYFLMGMKTAWLEEGAENVPAAKAYLDAVDAELDRLRALFKK